MTTPSATNLYIHFPFCRRKCTYCALHSRAGTSTAAREEYVRRLIESIRVELGSDRVELESGRVELESSSPSTLPDPTRPYPTLKTIYFGGGSPALCDLEPLFAALAPLRAPDCEFTVELHPLDVTADLLKTLRSGGVNRISMGVQSLNDDILRHMGRGYTFMEAERAFYLIREYFDNAGIDLIVGYPGETQALTPRHARLAKWGLTHCSVYSLILEENSILAHLLQNSPTPNGDSPPTPQRGQSPYPPGTVPPPLGDSPPLPDDDTVLNRISIVSRFLQEIGLKRYEISNYARPGFECRHNMAVWSGEDYIGLGEGAHGRIGLSRTEGTRDCPRGGGGTVPPGGGDCPRWGVQFLTPEQDLVERKIFALRTRNGLDLADTRWGQSPSGWREILDRFAAEGLLARSGTVYRLTERGTEICDSILAELV